MKVSSSLCRVPLQLLPVFLLHGSPLYAQGSPEDPVVKEGKAADVVPEAILRAPVLGEQVTPGGAVDGGDVVIQRIARPVYTASELAAAAAALTAPPEPTAARRALLARAREEAKAKAPVETRFFSPRVTAFADGVSLVEWAAWDASGSFADLAAWVKGPDLAGTIAAAGDLDVPLAGTGKVRRYLLTVPVVIAGGRPLRRLPQPPAPQEFGESVPGTATVVMERGNGADAQLMEPLRALLAAYADPERSAKIASDAAALKNAQAAAAEAAARAAADPAPPEPQVIRFYTSDDDEIATLEKAARGHTAAPATGTVPAAPQVTLPVIPASGLPALSPAK